MIYVYVVEILTKFNEVHNGVNLMKVEVAWLARECPWWVWRVGLNLYLGANPQHGDSVKKHGFHQFIQHPDLIMCSSKGTTNSHPGYRIRNNHSCPCQKVHQTGSQRVSKNTGVQTYIMHIGSCIDHLWKTPIYLSIYQFIYCHSTLGLPKVVHGTI